jgi:hypothetical protein
MTLRLFAAAVALAVAASGQPPGGRFGQPDPGPFGGGVRFLGAEAGMPGRIVKNAPYSAEMVTEITQTLADGNRIHQTNSVKVYRDSEGRTRSEQSLKSLNALAPGANLPPLVFINDPVAGVNYALNPTAKTANKSGGARRPGGGRGGNRPEPNRKTESLGSQNIEGVSAEGTRTTMTIAAGEIGNEQAIQVVTESWYSPDLKAVVLSKRSDPRSGEVVTRMVNLSRSEPAASLFQVPGDYKVSEAPPRPARPSTRQ